MPSLAGPGSIAVVITMSSTIDGQHGIYRLGALAAVVLAILLTALICWVVLRWAGNLQRILGVNGVDSMSRIMGFLLACIGVQFIINGIKALVHGGL
jgi:multiple antibiotic resistance protein